MQLAQDLPDQFSFVLSKKPCPGRRTFKTLLGAKGTKIFSAHGKHREVTVLIETARAIAQAEMGHDYSLMHWRPISFDQLAILDSTTVPPSLFLLQHPGSVALNVACSDLQALHELVNEYSALQRLGLRWNNAVETLIDIYEQLPPNSSGRKRADSIDTGGLHLADQTLDDKRNQQLREGIQAWFVKHQMQ